MLAIHEPIVGIRSRLNAIDPDAIIFATFKRTEIGPPAVGSDFRLLSFTFLRRVFWAR